VNSSPSEHQRRFDRSVATFPVCSRCRPAAGMTGEQTVLLHEPVNPLAVDGLQAAGPPLAIEKRGDPAVAIDGTRVDEAPDVGGKFSVPVAALGAAPGPPKPSSAQRHWNERRRVCRSPASSGSVQTGRVRPQGQFF
jgi:hypothetical protein